eukprot:CAMPEP_0172003836 /NCGR_PEP_ID=MMETSP1041-20130122/4146_1 /TAXON_ID=464988 /ORGANISM="Hemiselmis andersenii, Strain CCMP439" /LENGTH=306 /DNA_ID=CAMNT_0012657631 /DNA_START=21 /DNA_END=941 /DNA_ORIENTATION=+
MTSAASTVEPFLPSNIFANTNPATRISSCPELSGDTNSAAALLMASARQAYQPVGCVALPPHGCRGGVSASPANNALLLIADISAQAIKGSRPIDPSALLPLILAGIREQGDHSATRASKEVGGSTIISPPTGLPTPFSQVDHGRFGASHSSLSSIDTAAGSFNKSFPCSPTSDLPPSPRSSCGEIPVSSLLNSDDEEPLAPREEAVAPAAKATTPRPPHQDLEETPKVPQPRYWTDEEHQRFLEALQRFGGNDHKAIAKVVGTRTPRQVRSHSQKFFEKVCMWAGDGLPSMNRKKNHAGHRARLG